MQPGLQLLAALEDEDIQWFLSTGEERQVIANTILFEEGQPSDRLVFILEGLVEVRVAAVPNQRLATLGPGELLGEISFLEQQVASASVTAAENSLILEIPFAALERQIQQQPEFAARLYRSFALTSMRRLKERVGQLGQRALMAERNQGVGSTAWQQLQAHIEKFKSLLLDTDQAALKNEGVVPDDFRARVQQAFPIFLRSLNELIGDSCGLPDSIRDELGARVQRETLPYLLLTRTTERLYAKPRGYAGDYLTIDWIYRREPGGSGRIGALLDECFLDASAAQAVRNRRRLLAQQIQSKLDEHPDRTVQITTLACGPAREVFDVFESLADPTRLQATLIDIDAQAIALVTQEAEKRNLSQQIRTVQGNLVYLSLGRVKLDLADQDLVYSIGLIDYFGDKFVVKLIDYGHTVLRSGGRIILGNFHPRNTDKAFMDHVVDWRLIHRSEEEMNSLFSSSSFGRPCAEILYEEQRVNLFAVADKQS